MAASPASIGIVERGSFGSCPEVRDGLAFTPFRNRLGG